MDFSVKSGTPEKQRSGCLIVGAFETRKLHGAAQQIDHITHGALAAILRRGDLSGKLGQTLVLHNLPDLPSERLLLVGCGKEKDFGEARYREVAARAATALRETGATEATSYLTELEVKGAEIPWKIRQAVETTEGALYRFDQLKSEPVNERRTLRKMVLAVPKRSDLGPGEEAIRQGAAIADGAKLARDLGNLPGNLCTPTYLAEQAQALGSRHGLTVTILEREDMERLGMGALLSVARGSRQPPKLIVLEYRGAGTDEPPVALVGKGLTFDAGGISIKPAANMDEMKYDMCGGGAVFGALQAAAQLKLPINVVGIVPSSENLPDGNANKPGDIVKSMSGRTIEVLNTDAEGRLILCDALTYAERYKPAAVIDIATLTGACVIALGHHATGLLANNEALAREIINAGRYSYDRAWQLPLWDEYQKQLDSPFADMANIGGRDAGTITAACFLSRYAKNFKWAHLDIAGTAWRSGKDKGATGRPVPLLTQFLIARASKEKTRAGAMTRVDFYLAAGPENRRDLAVCRLADKVFQLGHRIYILTPTEDAAHRLDQLLWTFATSSFVPHAVNTGQPEEELPVLIGTTEAPGAHDDVLITLAADVPAYFSRFRRVAEVVGASEPERERARERFRYYRQRGYELQTHNL